MMTITDSSDCRVMPVGLSTGQLLIIKQALQATLGSLGTHHFVAFEPIDVVDFVIIDIDDNRLLKK